MSATDLELRQILDGLYDTDLPVEVLLLRLDEVVVALLHLRVDSAYIALDRRLPSVTLAHERHAVLPAIEQPTAREREKPLLRFEEPRKSQGGVKVKGLAWWIVAAVVMSFGELGNVLALQSA